MEISVIIPVKNGEAYLRQCLESVFSQTFKGEYEVILGIDPSEDKTAQIAEEFKKDHPNLIVENRENKGVQSNRMASLKIAKGKYVTFLDADDYYHKDYLKIMYEEIEKGYDVVNCSFYIDKNGKISKNSFTKECELDSVNGCHALLKDSYMRGFFWTKIYKKELFDLKLPILEGKKVLFEDTIINYFIYMHANKIKSIVTPLYYYRNNPVSITKGGFIDRYISHLFAFSYIRYLCDNNDNKGYLKGFLNTLGRSKLSLSYDKFSTRKILDEAHKKQIKDHKALLKDLSKKEKLDIAKYPDLNKYLKAII